MLQVSDLDGTMVGETDFADECMQQFTNYWNDTAALAGSVLVYNTGRSLGSFKQLYKQKNNKLCLPDVLITAVGTKVCSTGRSCCYVFEREEWHICLQLPAGPS